MDYDARARRLVGCAYCGAGVGQWCRGRRNPTMRTTHSVRRAMAAEVARDERRLARLAREEPGAVLK